MEVSQRSKLELPYNPAIPLLDIDPKEIKSAKELSILQIKFSLLPLLHTIWQISAPIIFYQHNKRLRN